MPTLSEILKDPNYVNANAETKQAIFDRYAPQDPDYANANAETKQAIEQRFGLVGAQAPMPPAQTKPSREETLGRQVYGPATARAILAAGTGYGSASPEYATVLRTGLTDLPVAVGEMTGVLSPEYIRQREAEYQAAAGKVPAAGLGRAFGGAITTAPLALIPGAPAGAGMLRTAATGAGIGAGASVVSTPTSGQGNFLAEKGLQALIGGVAGGAPTALINWLSPTMRAQKLVQEAAGSPEALAAIVRANQAQPNVLASQAAGAQLPNATAYQALLKLAETVDPKATARATRLANRDAQLAELTRIAGGATATETTAAQQAAFGTVRGVTAPQREAALTGAMQPKTVQLPPVRGPLGELLSTPTTAVREGVDVTPLTNAVKDIKTPPGIRASDVVQKTLSTLDSKLRDLAKEGDGFIHPEDLYTVRKELGTYISAAAKDSSNWDKKLAGSLQNSLQDAFDAAIEKAGGAGWKEYLSAYSAGMQAISRQELAARALDMFKKSPKRFVALVKGENPAEVEKIFGPGTYDIVKALPTEIGSLQKIAGDVQAGLQATEQAREGAKALTGILSRNAPLPYIPNMLNPVVTIGTTVLKGLEGKISAKTLSQLTKAAQSGANMNDLILMAPASERSAIVAALRVAPAWAQSFMSSRGANRLAPDNRNALAEQ